MANRRKSAFSVYTETKQVKIKKKIIFLNN